MSLFDEKGTWAEDLYCTHDLLKNCLLYTSLAGLITETDIQKRAMFADASKDEHGHLRCGAAVDVYKRQYSYKARRPARMPKSAVAFFNRSCV